MAEFAVWYYCTSRIIALSEYLAIQASSGKGLESDYKNQPKYNRANRKTTIIFTKIAL